MRFSVLNFLAVLPLAAARTTQNAQTGPGWKGMDIDPHKVNGVCFVVADFLTAFRTMGALSGGMNAARIKTSTICTALDYAAPAAIATGMKILVGIIAEDDRRYMLEKNALVAAIQAHGTSWIAGIIVGDADLYHKTIDVQTLITRINEVRSIVRNLGVTQPVGHVEAWGVWVLPENADVIKACDFIGADVWPYWQRVAITAASATVWSGMDEARNTVSKLKPGTWVWLTGTGWPVSGKTLGLAAPSIANAQTYWQEVYCAGVKNNVPIFMTAFQDYHATTSWGVVGPDFKPLYNLNCPA